MDNKVSSYIIKQGLIFGMVNVVLALLIYFMGASYFANHFFLIPLIMLVFTIVYPIVITIRFRNQNGNELSFKTAFAISFFMMLISGFITALFGILLYHVIDPEYPRQIQEKMTESLTEYMSKAGLSEEKIQDALDKNNFADKFTVYGQIKSFFLSIIFYAIFSLIVALIAKKSKPMFENQTL
jgi:hypothetical protein